MSILSVRSIYKNYGAVRALNGVSFDVPEGSVFGILGPNGSGKTTLLGIVLDVLKATSGDYAWLGGTDAQAARRQIGTLLETPNFYHYLSAVDNLRINAGIKERGHDDIDRVLQVVRLYERRHSKFSTYSLGMKQRLAIAAALLGNPRVLVLDEPTNGLDPEGITEIRSLVRSLSGEGLTVIMASHLLDEVEKVCTDVAILKKGELLVTGNVNEVMRSEDQIELQSDDLSALEAALRAMPGIEGIQTIDGLVRITANAHTAPAALNRLCMERGIALSHLALRKKSLETKFIELTAGGAAS